MIGVLKFVLQQDYSFQIAINDAVLQKYGGVYSIKTIPLKITITTENGELFHKQLGKKFISING
jgi:hypothetical protein